MLFRTPVIPDTSLIPINYHHKILMMGSCFTENVGKRLVELKLPVMINPLGILFNPESIAISIELALQPVPFTEKKLFLYQGLWSSLNHHGSFSDPKPEICLEKINTSLDLSCQWLQQTDYLILTFGTAWVYRHLPTGQIVANCHKLPANQFIREQLSVDEISHRFSSLIEKLTDINKKVQFLFTVSPIRHLRDGAIENQVSKSILVLSIQQLRNQFGNVHYFPSYEIMMDDLRDYRFYEADMVHPSAVAIDYIWDLFSKAWIDKTTLSTMAEIQKIRHAMEHKPLQPDSTAFKKFIEQQLNAIQVLSKKYPTMDFKEERRYFDSFQD